MQVVSISSTDVAEMLGKRHDNFLREVGKYIDNLGDEAPQYFVESKYKDSLGRERFCYNVTLAGCDLISGRMIGERGNAFREKYLQIFPKVEKEMPVSTDLTVEEVAKRLGCSERNVYRLIKNGKLQAIQKEVFTPTVKTFVTLEALEHCLAERGLV